MPLNCVLLRQRISCQEALAHPWMAAFDSGEVEAKNLSKEKMKKFLARQKWKVMLQLSRFVVVLFQTCDISFVTQKAGKALLALKRMAVLSKGDGTGSPINPREGERHILLLSYQVHLNLDLQLSFGEFTFIYFLLPLSFSQSYLWAQRQRMRCRLWTARCRGHLSSPRFWRTRQ